jgi:hypothetical protein
MMTDLENRVFALHNTLRASKVVQTDLGAAPAPAPVIAAEVGATTRSLQTLQREARQKRIFANSLKQAREKQRIEILRQSMVDVWTKQELVREFQANVRCMRQGSVMWKLPRTNGSVRSTRVFLDVLPKNNAYVIRWESRRLLVKHSVFSLLQGTVLYVGSTVGGFARKKTQKLLEKLPPCTRDLAFSLVNPDGSTLDLACKSDDDFYSWTRALNQIVFGRRGVQTHTRV